MIQTLLIANRGEIACRVIRTARRMGIRTIAVYSDADAQAMHVTAADDAVHIGPPAAAQSYLRGAAIIDAALRFGADAIHPGYGFLSENAQFARDCAQAGLCFVGPPIDAIEAMGSKRAALQLMAAHDVPVLPGYHGEQQDDQALLDAAQRVGFPLIIKPSAGGGGKGMQVAHDLDELRNLLPATRRVALAAFADETLLLERYLHSARHIEIQVFADDHGNCVHLYERDCSLQRRHQKVVEEAPAVDLPSRVREQMAQVAVRAARAIDYRGAGTVEFLYDTQSHDHSHNNGHDNSDDDGGGFYFMEMNTRLQVEHPVTEMITGVDLVQWQLLVAAGEALPLRQEQIHIAGHAIEARIYAEDPQRDFLPATGRVQWMHFPEAEGVRVDAGVGAGDSVSAFYDPMIAKLIVHGASRDQAIARLRGTLRDSDLGPLANNIGFLRDLAAHQQWVRGALDTGFLARTSEQLRGQVSGTVDAALAANAWLLTAPPSAPSSPWDRLRGMRLNLTGCERSRLRIADEIIDCITEHHHDHHTVRLGVDDEPHTLRALRRENDAVIFEHNGRLRRVRVRADGKDLHLDDGHARAKVTVLDNATAAQGEQFHGAGQLLSPMPGCVLSVSVAKGDRVEARQALAILEAMKMEHTLVAPGPGSITAVNCRAGEQVEEGVLLIAIELD